MPRSSPGRDYLQYVTAVILYCVAQGLTLAHDGGIVHMFLPLAEAVILYIQFVYP
jgi:hypothetical protein